MASLVATGQITIVDANDVIIDSVQPSNPVLDQLWFDTGITPPALKRWNGSAWISANVTPTEYTNLMNTYNDLITFRNSGPPTNSPSFGTINASIFSTPADGSVVAKVPYNYTQATAPDLLADNLYLYIREGGGTPTQADTSFVFPPAGGSFTISVKPLTTYSFGIQACRNTANGVKFTSMVNSGDITSPAGNYTGNIGGIPYSSVTGRNKTYYLATPPTTATHTLSTGDVFVCTDVANLLYYGSLWVWDGSQWVTAADRTSVTIANGLVTAGRLEVGTAALSSNNAGVNGAVTASPNTDVRFWAGSTWANSATAPFRVQNDGKLFATGATITGDLTVTSGTTYDAIQNSLRQHLVSGDTVEVFRFQKGTTGSRGTPPSGYGSKYSIRPYESLFGDSCIAIEETTTNLVSANALSVLNNFSTKGLTATLTTLTETFLGTPITRVTYVASTDASGALTSMKNSNVTAASTNNGIQHAFGTYASNTPYSASIYWRSNRPGLVVTGIQSAGAVWANNTTVALGGGWYRTTCTHSEATVRTEAKYWVFYDTLLALGETVQIDWVCHQVEQKAFPTSYGTRTAPGILSIPTLGTQLNFGKFSIVGWIKRDVTGIKQTICGVSPKPIFSINASNYLQLDWLDSGNIARQYITTLSVADKNWHLVGFSWDQLNANCIFFLDGSSETKTGVIQTLSSTASSGFAFGVSTVGVTGDIGNMLYSNFVVNKTNNFTAAEVLKMYNTRRPFVDTAPINTAPNASGISSTYS